VPSSTTSSELAGEGLAPEGLGANGFGERLKATRVARGLSLQELATLADVSASFISQIENGKSQPSVATLFALATSLNVPVDDLFGARARLHPDSDARAIIGAHAPPSARPWGTSEYSNRISVIHPSHRAKLEPADGVEWERLAATPDRGVNFKRIVYAPGASSAPGNQLVSHAGHEYGYGISGEVEVLVGNLVTILGAGDSIDFASTLPHLLRNVGSEDFVGLWVDHYPFH
jgi:transcriptional regulator with XRE-family HTH domain